jgi:chromosome segregation ATPase
MMEEGVKNKLIVILVVLTCIFLVMALDSCNNSHKNKLARQQEMVTRIELEENLNKISQEKNALEQKLNSITRSLNEEKISLDETKKSLAQEQSVSESLREELQKVTKLKETLEEDLKEALVESHSKPVLKK